MEGQELNAVYDGYSYMPMYMSHSHSTAFEHTYGYEPTAKNHSISGYGLFGAIHFKRQMGKQLAAGVSYSSFNKTCGPPYNHFNPVYDPIEHNEYLLEKGVDIDALRLAHGGTGVARV